MEERIAVLIPAYNPDEKMITLVESMAAEFAHIIVVNDGCDASFSPIFDTVKENVSLVVHEINKGKGRALKTGYAYALEHLSSVQGVVTVDADGQHTVSDVRRCCEVFLANPKEAVFGCRDFTSDEKIPPRSRFGNRLTSRLLKFFCDISLSDTQTGLRVLPREILPAMLEVEGERYEYEMNGIFALKEQGVSWSEVPIEVIYIDDNESSHFNPIKDSLKIYKVFLKFCISSFGSAILDLLIFALLERTIAGLYPLYHIFVSTAVARVCSGTFNFFMNRAVFGGKTKVSTSSGRYLTLWVIQMCVSAILVNGLSRLIPVGTTLIKFVVDTLLFFFSYKIQQKWVFAGESKSRES